MKKSKRLYTAQTIISGIRAISALRSKALDFSPPEEEPVATHEGYCTKCRGKKSFQIEDTATMKNGAVRHKGKCADCGTTVSAFARGTTDAG